VTFCGWAACLATICQGAALQASYIAGLLSWRLSRADSSQKLHTQTMQLWTDWAIILRHSECAHPRQPTAASLRDHCFLRTMLPVLENHWQGCLNMLES
jgi:hypothetical protein